MIHGRMLDGSICYMATILPPSYQLHPFQSYTGLFSEYAKLFPEYIGLFSAYIGRLAVAPLSPPCGCPYLHSLLLLATVGSLFSLGAAADLLFARI